MNVYSMQIMSEIEDAIELDDAEEVSEEMTSLGQLVFVDSHSRHMTKRLTNDVNPDIVDSISLAFENLHFMPYNIIENYGSNLKTLDISNNQFSRRLQFLGEFENLTSLIMDHNNVDSHTILPVMPKLKLLWLNHNCIKDLFPFIKNLYSSVPNLRYLSLMGNKAAPSYLNGGSFYDYLQYRLFVISWFPNLEHLDDRTVTQEQHEEARRLFKRPILEQLVDHASVPKFIKQFNNKVTSMFSHNSFPSSCKEPKGLNVII